MRCSLIGAGPDKSIFNSSFSPAHGFIGLGIFNAALAPSSLLLNAHLIFAVLLSRTSRTIDNILKVNISFANFFMVCLAQFPFTVSMLGIADSEKWYRVLGSTMITVSLAALCILTFDKYIAVFHPFSHYKFQQHRKLFALILASWLLPCGAGALTLHCNVKLAGFVIITVMKIAMASFMVIADLRILVTLYKIRNEVVSLENRFSQSDKDRGPRSIKGIRCTVVCLLLLLLCHAPYSATSLKFIFYDLEFRKIHLYLNTLVYMPAAVTPILIIWTTSSFRTTIFNFYNRCWVSTVSFFRF